MVRLTRPSNPRPVSRRRRQNISRTPRRLHHVDSSYYRLCRSPAGVWVPNARNRYAPASLYSPLLTHGCAASGLYYLSELVEEHTVPAKKFLMRLIYTVIGMQLLLLVVDRLPIWQSLLSIGSHAIYLQNLRFFPIVRLSDPIFIASCRTLASSFPLPYRSADLFPLSQSSSSSTTTSGSYTSPTRRRPHTPSTAPRPPSPPSLKWPRSSSCRSG